MAASLILNQKLLWAADSNNRSITDEKFSVTLKVILFNDSRPGLLKDEGVVDMSEVVALLDAHIGQEVMEAIITHIDALRADLSRRQQEGAAVPLSSVSL